MPGRFPIQSATPQLATNVRVKSPQAYRSACRIGVKSRLFVYVSSLACLCMRFLNSPALQRLAAIVEDIVESPNRAHHRDYWVHLDRFEQEQQEMAKWTLAGKQAQLKEKMSHAPKD